MMSVSLANSQTVDQRDRQSIEFAGHPSRLVASDSDCQTDNMII